MNYFFALSLGRTAEAIQRHLLTPLMQADQAQQLRWSLPQNLHITLAYMGRLNADSLQEARSLASTIRAEAFALRLQDVVHFPDAKSRILAIAVEPAPALLDLQRRLCEGLQQAGIDCDSRPYRPHITLARLKHRQVISGWQLPSYTARLPVADFVLFGSAPSTGQPQAYQEIARFAFSGAYQG